MSLRRYAVVQVGQEWRIIGAERQMGHFGSFAEAALATARLGALARREGCAVEVLIQEQFGELKSVRRDEEQPA